nr:phospholipase-like, aminotransferase-like mobile domain protein [Tanacetum cinerariifolium]
EYPATIHVRSKLHLFQLFKDRLNENRRTLFKTTCFGPWLDIIYVENDDGMIHYVLQKQCCSDDDNFYLPLIYHVNGHSLHFRRREFCLLTGFKFGSISFHEYRNGDISFRNRLFPEKIGYDVKIVDLFALFDDEEKFSKLSDEDAIRLCLLLSLAVIFMRRELVSLVDHVYLRMVNDIEAWNSFSLGEHIWRSPHVSIGGLYGEYLNKRSAARAAKKKSSEDFHPSECVREASLIDRVCNLECICETLLTLSKVVKSLEGRIYKLESIIQSTFYPSRVVEKKETLKKVFPKIEDYLQSTSKDEPDLKDHTSPKESEIQRLYNHREARLNKIVEKDKQRKFPGHMNSSAHMKIAIKHCVPKKRKYVDVLRSPLCALPKILNVPSIEQLENQNNVLNPLMIEKCKSVKPWIEDLSRPFKRIDKIFLSHARCFLVGLLWVIVNSLGATILLLIAVSGMVCVLLMIIANDDCLMSTLIFGSCTCGSPDRPIWIGIWSRVQVCCGGEWWRVVVSGRLWWSGAESGEEYVTGLAGVLVE